MILSDSDIMRLYVEHSINDCTLIKPYIPRRIQPASYDLALGNKFRTFNRGTHTCIDPSIKQEGLTDLVEVFGDGVFVIHPGQFVLGVTEEVVHLPSHIAARVEGKSSLGRIGLMIHSTAGWIDPGFHGAITLELGNAVGLPIILRPGMLIGQLAFMHLENPAARPYGHPELGSKYQGDVEPAESAAWQTAK